MDRKRVEDNLRNQSTEQLLAALAAPEGEFEPEALAMFRNELARREVHVSGATQAIPNAESRARCSLHPALPAIATCARCGRFICFDCRDASAVDHRCVECALRAPVDVPALGGWLVLAAIVLVLYPIRFLGMAFNFVEALRASSWELPSGPSQWFVISLWRVLSTGAMSAFSVITMPRFFGKRASAARLMQYFFFANISVGVIEHVLSAALGGPIDFLGLIVPVLISGLWINYFQTGKRVAKTFVVPDRE